MEVILHPEKFLGLLFGQLVDGNPGPHREDLGDRLLIDLVEQVHAGRPDFGLPLGLTRLQFLLPVPQSAGFFKVLGFHRGLLTLDNLSEVGLEFPEVVGGVHAPQT